MRLLIALWALLLPIVASAHNPAVETLLGFKSEGSAGSDFSTTGQALNTADGGDADSCGDTIFAYSINGPFTCTLDKFQVYVTGVNGTLGASDFVAELFASDGSQPTGAAISSQTALTASVAGSAWSEWAGFNDVLAANAQYWVVAKNCNASPATNYPTVLRQVLNSMPIPPNRGSGMSYLCSTNGGTSWAACTNPSSAPAVVVECAEGYAMGYPFTTGSAGNAVFTPNIAYDTREAGVIMTVPDDAKLRVIGGVCATAKIGTPAAGLRYRLYNGTTLIASTGTRAAALVNTSPAYLKLYFASPQILDAGATIRLVAGAAATGDTSSNGYGVGFVNVSADAEAQTLKPFNMSRTTYDGSTWTETTTIVPSCALILDNGDYFEAGATGGSDKYQGINGGLNK